jgi:small-conductance mechanosensitive channel
MLAKIEFGKGIEDAWSKITTFVPKLAAFLAVLLIGSIVARLVGRWATRLLGRLGVDRGVEKVGLDTYVSRTGMPASKLLGTVVRYVVWFVALTTAFSVFGPTNPVTRFFNSMIAYVPRAIVAVAILAIAAVAARWAANAMRRATWMAHTPAILGRIVPISIWVLGAFAAVDQLGIAPATVHALFFAMLAIIVGSAIIAIGGGGIQPMRAQWEAVIAKQKALNSPLPPPTAEEIAAHQSVVSGTIVDRERTAR